MINSLWLSVLWLRFMVVHQYNNWGIALLSTMTYNEYCRQTSQITHEERLEHGQKEKKKSAIHFFIMFAGSSKLRCQ